MAKKKQEVEEQPVDVSGMSARERLMTRLGKKAEMDEDVFLSYGEDIRDLSQRQYRMSSGNPILNYVLNGGLIRGAGVQLYGEENVGKSFSGHVSAAYVQNVLKENVLWIVAVGEQYDRRLAMLTGSRFDDAAEAGIVLLEGVTAEKLVDIGVEEMASGDYGLVILDSMAALRPKDEITKKSSENPKVSGQVALVQRFVSKAVTALRSTAQNTALLVLNQARDTPEMIWTPGGMQKSPPHAPGGRYARHIALADVFMEKKGNIYEKRGKDDIIVGRTIQFTGQKGKVTGPHGRSDRLDIYIEEAPQYGFSPGQIDHAKGLARVAQLRDVFEVSGSWVSFGGQKWQGLDKVVETLRTDKDLYAAVDAQVNDTYFVS